jgi:hypothetical protein
MNWRLNSYLVYGAVAIAALTHLGRASAQAPAAAPPASAIATQMIPANALATVMIFPQEIISAPEMKMMPIEIADAWMVENIGVELSGIESLTVVVGTPGPMTPEFGVWIQLNQDLDARRLKRERFAGPAEQVSGHMAIPLADVPGAYLHRVDARTYVVATGNFLGAMLTTNGKVGPLAQFVASRKRQTPIVAAMVMEPVRGQIQGAAAMMTQNQNVPMPLRQLTEIPNLTEAVLIEASSSASGFSRLTLVANDDADAGRLSRILDDGLQFGKDVAMNQALQGVEGEGAVPDATRNYLQRLGNEITTMLTPQQSGQELAIQLDSIAGTYASSGVLVGLLLPAVQASREAARRMSSSNNLKQILLAFHNYHDAYRNFPAAIQRDPQGQPLLSWRVAILPFIEQAELYNEFHLDEPWDSEHNIRLLDRMPSIYADPSLPLPPGMTIYQVPVGEGLLFDPSAPVRFAQITDGTSNTIAAFEANAEVAVPWTKPADAKIDPTNPLAAMAKHRAGGFNVGLADGSVRFISSQIDPQMFWALLTRAGGEVVQIP